ncbi:MAG: sugar phosphate isomerase/epimerase, partial [Methylobacteriaceae bacterium]|nr:sugar phosphate isomerase/epimerase [Methylobacteriaceae bacterium]
MTLKNRLGGHTNSYHGYRLEQALEGIAAAGYRYVELSAVRGWTEHVPLDADAKALGGIQRMLNTLGLVGLSLSGHSDLTTSDGLELGLLAVDLCERMGIGIMNTAIGGHYSEHEDEAAFMGNIHKLADHAAARDIRLGIEIHGEITKSGAAAIPVLDRIGRANVLIN